MGPKILAKVKSDLNISDKNILPLSDQDKESKVNVNNDQEEIKYEQQLP